MYRRILLTTDFSEASLRLMRFTTMLARRTEARIILLHVDEEEQMFGIHSSDDLIRFVHDIAMKRDEWMDNLVEEIEGVGVPCSQVRASGYASDEILNAIDHHDIDLVAMATIGVEGMKRILMGSTAKRVLRRATCAVLSTGPEFQQPPSGGVRRILYPFDGSGAARRGIGPALQIAEKFDADVELFQVVKVPTLVPALPGEPPISVPRATVDYLVDDFLAEMQAVVDETRSARLSAAVEIGADEAETIADHARGAEMDLILLARGRKSRVRRYLFGRVAQGVVQTAGVPVLSLATGT